MASFGVVPPERVFSLEFQRRGQAPVLLSRALGDSSTVTSRPIPWNSCGACMARPSAHFIYRFFNPLNPVISFLFSWQESAR
jgi:NhaC family Na+:H+ antiporter